MENVRDGCKRIFDEIIRQNSELEAMLQNVATTTENLKGDIEQAYNVDDLVDCEKDATEAHARVKDLFSRPGQRSEEEEDELDGLFDECVARLRYLVDRRVSPAEAHSLFSRLKDFRGRMWRLGSFSIHCKKLQNYKARLPLLRA